MLGLEQFDLDHGRGSSQDHSRIIRLSYHTPGYVELAKHAYAAWAEVEEEADEQLVFKTGGLDLWPANPAYPMSDYTGSMEACGVAYERLSAAEVMARWPQFILAGDVTGIYQADAGIATPNLSKAAHRRLARDYGAAIRDNAPVTSIRVMSGPSRPYGPLADGAVAWRAINHLALNYLSLVNTTPQEGATALRDLLHLYAVGADDDVLWRYVAMDDRERLTALGSGFMRRVKAAEDIPHDGACNRVRRRLLKVTFLHEGGAERRAVNVLHHE